MRHYSVDSSGTMFVEGYGFLSFAKNMSKNVGTTLNDKRSQKLLDHAKQSATDVFKTASKRLIRKTAKATGDLICNNIADRIAKVSETS